MSVTVNTIAIEGGNQLKIVGDSGANTINIVDQGNGHIDVTNGKGKALGSADGVTFIKFNGKDGQDTVNYTLANPLTNTQRVVFELGKKADHVNVDLSEGIENANLRLRIDGGAGADALAVVLGSLTAAKAHLELDGGDGADTIEVTGAGTAIDANSLLYVDLLGGAGKDSLATTFGGQVLGKINLQSHANQGADTIATNVTIDAGSTGIVRAVARGQKGVDNVTLNVVNNTLDDEGASSLAALHAKIYAPGELDELTFTDNVTVITVKKPAAPGEPVEPVLV